MAEQKSPLRGRTFLAGKVISSFGQSSIDCVVRRISDEGATIEVESVIGVPEHFLLLIPNEGGPRPCKRMAAPYAISASEATVTLTLRRAA